jgi:hypothetical protein
VAEYKLLKKGSAALKFGLENWFKRSRVWSIASMTRNATWPNDEITKLHKVFFFFFFFFFLFLLFFFLI